MSTKIISDLYDNLKFALFAETVVCINCGKKYKRIPPDTSTGGDVCSNKCAMIFLSTQS